MGMKDSTIKWLQSLFEWIKSFFSEESGPSTTRLIAILWMVTLCFNLTFLTVYATVHDKDVKLPPLEAASGYVAITGLVLAAKVGQRVWGENPVTGGTPPQDPPKQP